MLSERIGFVGAGQMATALGQGLVKAGLVSAGQLLAGDPVAEARDRFSRTTGGKATVAVLFPVLFCCGTMVLVFLLFMGAIASSFGAMMHLYK